MTTKLTLFTATLVQDSALSVSGLDRETSANQPFALVETTVEGKPALVPTFVGRGLKGAVVAMARRFFNPLPHAVSDVVEEGEKRPPRRSAWEFADATAAGEPSLRAGVSIRQKTGACAGRVLYDREVIPAGTQWQLSFRVDPSYVIDDAEFTEAEGILGYVLAEHWAKGRCWLGGGAARGLGWCHIDDLKAYRFDVASYEAWVKSGRSQLPTALEAVPVVSPTRSWCFSLGWHYYYRWAYTDSVRKTGGRLERHGLFPLDKERENDSDGAPKELSVVRRLFGYTGDNEGSAGIGEGDHAQLMGRVFVNAGLEVVGENVSDDDRFLPPTFLKELGMPRPSAVEHYLKQPDHPNPKGRTDRAELLTYGDAAGYDTPGELAGRKFYLDRKDAYGSDGKSLLPGLAADHSDANKPNDRSTLALEASKPGRKFRFTVRFRDLDAAELAAILVALCPDQFKGVLGGTHTDGYCSKLGYARPLGWGSVRIEAKTLLFLDEASDTPALKPEAELDAWMKTNHQKTGMQDEWLAIHRRNHPNADDYPQKDGQIYTFHTTLRAEHSRNRRYKKDGTR